MNGLHERLMLLALLMALLGWSAVAVETGTAVPATMQDCLVAALLGNRGLKSALNAWEQHQAVSLGADALPDPKLNYGYFIEPIETRVGPQRQKVGLIQGVPWFGTRGLREAAASARAQAAARGFDAARLSLFARVSERYAELWHLSQAVALTERHMQLIMDLERISRTRLKAGSGSHGEVIRAQVELGKLDDRLRSLRELRMPLAAALNADLGREATAPIVIPGALPAAAESFEDEEARLWLSEGNPHLLRLRDLVHSAEAEEGLARRRGYPDLAVGVDYIETGEARTPNTMDSGKDALIAMVSLNVPLWSKVNRGARKEAASHTAALNAARDEAAGQLRAELDMALFKYREAHRRASLYADALAPKASQALQVTQQAFESGRTGFADLIDAQRTLLDFELAVDRATADQTIWLARVEALTGQALSQATRDLEHTVLREYSSNEGQAAPDQKEEYEMKTSALWAVAIAAGALSVTTPAAIATEGDTTVEKQAVLQTTCPVMGGKINKKLYADVKGKRIYVCCAGCIGLIQKEPDTYIKKLREAGVTIAKVPVKSK